jgi:protein phosphatase 1L
MLKETENQEGRRTVAGAVPTLNDFQSALESALEKVDREVQRISHWSYQGSTAVVIWIHEDRQHGVLDETNDPALTNITETKRTIIAANIGDSRAVLCRNDTAWELTRDHKPNDPTEQARIESSGGKVVWCGDVDKEGEPILERGIYRVNGNLALSRAIGDRSERPHVTADPEIIAIPVQEEDEFIILASDGLWDVLESNEAVDLVQRLIQQGLPRDQVATWIVEESIRRGTYDNVTVVIIWLDRVEASSKT